MEGDKLGNNLLRESILLTGGLGYIGSHLAIDVLDKIRSIVGEEKAKKLKFYEADVCSQQQMSRIFRENKIGAVIHLAALKTISESINDPLNYYQVNVSGTLNLLNCMFNNKVDCFIFSSSAAVYGMPEYLPVDEKHPTGNCTNPYGKSKFIVEEMIKDLKKDPKLDWKVISLRYFNPVGCHESGLLGENPKNTPTNLFPVITNCAVTGSCLSVFGSDYDTQDGTAIRDYIHINDLVDGHIAALDFLSKMERDKKYHDVFNLGTGNGCSVLQAVEMFEKVFGTKINYQFMPRREGDCPNVVNSVDKARKILNWTARRTLTEACRNIYSHKKLNK